MNDLFVVPLTQGHFAIVDAEDAPLVAGKRWYSSRAYQGIHYARTKHGGVDVTMHRLLMGAGKGEVVDHIDHNSLNNTRSNLRLCTTKENAMNRRGGTRANTSGYLGVTWSKKAGRWQAQVGDGQRNHFGGYFDTKEEAARARDSMAQRLHGEFASLNFPKDRVVHG